MSARSYSTRNGSGDAPSSAWRSARSSRDSTRDGSDGVNSDEGVGSLVSAASRQSCDGGSSSTPYSQPPQQQQEDDDVVVVLAQRWWWPQWHRPHHASLDLFASLRPDERHTQQQLQQQQYSHDSSGDTVKVRTHVRDARASDSVFVRMFDWYYALLRPRRARMTDTAVACAVARVRRATAPPSPMLQCLSGRRRTRASQLQSPSTSRGDMRHTDGVCDGVLLAAVAAAAAAADTAGGDGGDGGCNDIVADDLYSIATTPATCLHDAHTPADGTMWRDGSGGGGGGGLVDTNRMLYAFTHPHMNNDDDDVVHADAASFATPLQRAVVRGVSYAQLLKMAVLVALVLLGNTMQVLMLNFWLHSFPADRAPGNYTTFAVSSMTYAVFFLVTLAVYVAVKRPNLRFARSRHGLLLLLCVGVADTASSVLTIYAATHVSEVLQALSMCTAPLVMAVFQKHLLRDPRNYCHRLLVLSFACTVVGVAVATSHPLLRALLASRGVATVPPTLSQPHAATSRPTHPHNKHTVPSTTLPVSTLDQLLWALLYFAAVLPVVVQNVVQTDYMVTYTRDALFEQWLIEKRTGVDVAAAAVATAAAQQQATTAPTVAANAHVVATQPILSVAVLAQHMQHCTTADGACTHDKQQRPLCSDTASAAYGTFVSHHTRPPPPPPPSLIVDDASVSPSMFSLASGRTHVRVRYDVAQGNDLVVKLVLLAGDTTLQAGMVLLLLPVDALPWFGRSASVAQAWQTLVHNAHYVTHDAGVTLLYLVGYCCSFIFTYVGVAYLDQYSVTLCSMVSQLASPFTALLLVLAPRLNLSGDVTPWYASAVAVVLLATGALLYVRWDTCTILQKTVGEFALKEAFVRPRIVLQHE